MKNPWTTCAPKPSGIYNMWEMENKYLYLKFAVSEEAAQEYMDECVQKVVEAVVRRNEEFLKKIKEREKENA